MSTDPLVTRIFAVSLAVVAVLGVAGIVVLALWDVAVPDQLSNVVALVIGGLLGAFRFPQSQAQVVVAPPPPPPPA